MVVLFGQVTKMAVSRVLTRPVCKLKLKYRKDEIMSDYVGALFLLCAFSGGRRF